MQHKGALFATSLLSGPATHALGQSLAHLHCRVVLTNHGQSQQRPNLQKNVSASVRRCASGSRTQPRRKRSSQTALVNRTAGLWSHSLSRMSPLDFVNLKPIQVGTGPGLPVLAAPKAFSRRFSSVEPVLRRLQRSAHGRTDLVPAPLVYKRRCGHPRPTHLLAYVQRCNPVARCCNMVVWVRVCMRVCACVCVLECVCA